MKMKSVPPKAIKNPIKFSKKYKSMNKPNKQRQKPITKYFQIIILTIGKMDK